MIVVLKGGNSAEREVSLASAKSVVDALIELGQDFKEVDAADHNWLEQINRNRPSLVVIALHGTFGEDGKVQQILEKNHIRYTGSASAVCELAFDKHRAKEKLKAAGVLVPGGILIASPNEKLTNPITPLVVKPNKQGSSFGVTIVRQNEDLQKAIVEAFHYDTEVLAEEYLPGTEFTCGVIDLFGKEEALPVIEIVPKSEFFDYFTKYDPVESTRAEICPARITKELSCVIQEASLHVFRTLKIQQYCRVDWIVHNGQPYFLEVNTLPGITKTSLLPKELAAAGISYAAFVAELINNVKVSRPLV